MKNLYYILMVMAIGLLNSTNAYSQESVYNRLAYEDGDISINAGMSFGLIGYGYGYYGSSGFPLPLQANVDIGINQYLSIGGYAGYLGMSYGSGNNRYKFTSLSFGGQGTFHASTFLNDQFDFDIDDEKIDYYARVLLGIEIHSWKHNGENFNNYYYDNSGSRVIFGPVLGVRYMFKPNFGAYAEGGRGSFGWFTLGVSFKI